MLLSIVTPTFNRSDNLINLFNSLNNQVVFNFEWIIIDDGSNDSTSLTVSNFTSSNFRIIYKVKKNGGKHTALNLSLQYVTGKLFFVVDSDDTLTSNATEIIEFFYKKYKKNIISGFWFLQGFNNGKLVGKKFNSDESYSNYVKQIANVTNIGDKKCVYISKIRKKFFFPEFMGENFIGESLIHTQISKIYDAIFINKIIYMGNYISGGLTSQGRRMRFKNPMGGFENSIQYLDKRFRLILRIKKFSLLCIYSAKTKYHFSFMYNRISSPYRYLFAIIYFPLKILDYLKQI